MELKGYRVAGSLYLLKSVATLLLGGGLSVVSTILGLALLLIQDDSKLEALRFLVLAWVIVSVIIVMIGSASLGYWGVLISALLFGGAISGLMLDKLTQQSIVILGVIGVVGMFFPVFVS